MLTTVGDLDRRLRQRELDEKLLGMGRKYLIMSGKGGVGKTTIAASLALAKAREGKRTGILDIDFHGPNLPGALYMEGRVRAGDDGKLIPTEYHPNLFVLSLQQLLGNPDEAVLWRGPRKMRAILQFLSDTAWPGLDYFFIDSPPGTGDEALTVARNVPGLQAILVTTGHSLSLSDAAKAVGFLRSTGVGIFGVVDSLGFMVCPNCGEDLVIHRKEGVEAFAARENIPLLARLPLDVDAQKRSENMGKPMLEAAPASRFSQEIIKLAEKL
ncbi:MAG: Mrp/NBP35 family ATP-binding protein [Deltaproteobacteria bacterium]|jgi:Mrp family chromosome partitioning ATPase|nr:Mrp/NBP35 family ATP-binding protein [Deltaproteobacteria bacterium]